MAATVTLLKTIQWAQPYLNWANLVIGTAGEPAISSANLVLQTIVGPPFRWPWNRSTANFQTTQGVQDYSLNIAQFGFMESVSAQMCGVITSVVANGTTAVFQAITILAAARLTDSLHLEESRRGPRQLSLAAAQPSS